jgi:probable rRNA maturation factor
MNDDSDSCPGAGAVPEESPEDPPRTGGVPVLAVDIVIDDDGWETLSDAEARVAQAARAVADGLRAGRVPVLIAKTVPPTRDALALTAVVALSCDDEVQRLNAAYRGFDKATNVLSFPALPTVGLPAGATDAHALAIGDIVLAHETVVREACELDIPAAHHLQHLVVHGLLHLIGYDHETDGEAEVMEALETALLATLSIPDPYSDPLMRPRPTAAADEGQPT